MADLYLTDTIPERQLPRAKFDFIRTGYSSQHKDRPTNELCIELLELARELGIAEDMPVPPSGLPGFRDKPDEDVMEVVRAGAEYALAIAAGEHRSVWIRYERVRIAMMKAFNRGRQQERDDRAELMAQAMRQQSAEVSRKQREASVYFIQSGEEGPIKIGMAIDVPARLRGLQTSHHAKLTLLASTEGGSKQERAYHKQFAEHRREGEWFSPHPDIISEITRLTTGGARG